MLGELGVNGTQAQSAWLDALDRARHASDGRSARRLVPYRGLEPYGEDDAALFFGREEAAAMLLGRLASTGGILCLVGPSGSGKSSLIRAGVVPAVRAGRLAGAKRARTCRLVTPGRAPLRHLDEAVSGGVADQPGRLFLVVDQVEEIFAAAVDTAERAGFLAEIARLAASGARVLVGLRADFYEAAAREPVLLAALRDNQVLLGPMSAEEVRRAVVEPARTAGVAVGDDLVDLLLADLAPRNPGGFAYDPGALPLLSHALLATWDRAGRNTLTVADYLATGGIREAMRHSAEDVYERLDPAGKIRARQVFLRLVNVGEDTPLTRRRVSHAELASSEHPWTAPNGGTAAGEPASGAAGDAAGKAGEAGQAAGTAGAAEQPGAHEVGVHDVVVGRFVEARLLTADAETLELSHEILLTAWPRLSAWIDEDRTGLRLHRQLGDAANAWLGSGRDDALLLRGSRLQATAEWAAERAQPGQVNRNEQALLEASLAHAAAERAGARRRTRRMQQLIAALVVLVAATSALAVYAFDARSSANSARVRALSRQVAIEASQLEGTQPNLAMQLAVAAYRIAPTMQARSVLLDATAHPMPTRVLGPTGPTFTAAAGGSLAVAHASTSTVDLFRLTTTVPRRVARFRAGSSSTRLFATALRPDGRLLATGGEGKKVLLFDVTAPAHPRRVATLSGFSSSVYSIAFAPNGGEVAAASADGTVREWDVTTPSRPRLVAVVRAPKKVGLHAVAYSPEGGELAAAGANGTLLTWPDGSSTATVVAGAGSANLESVAFSPSGDVLAAGNASGRVRLFDRRGATYHLSSDELG